MTCSYCATELPAGALFCGECGRPVSARPASAVRAVTSPVMPVDELVSPSVVARVAVPDAPEQDPLPGPPPNFGVDVAMEEAIIDAESRGAGWCAQCGALMSAADIFCGECGFVRNPATRARDTVALDPFPWGSGAAPSADPVAPVDSVEFAQPVGDVPAVASSQPVSLPEDDEDIDATRIVAPGARGDRFVLQFSTGESVTVTGAGLLGRNPVPEPGEFFDAMVTISDPGKSVSKTHLEFGQDGGAFWVSDRYSGNGTIVREPERPARRCEPGKRYRIARGTRVDIGEQFFVVS